MPYEVISRPGEKPKTKYEVVSKPKEVARQPGQSMFDTYMRMQNEGYREMAEGAKRVVAPGAGGWERTKGAGQAALGGLQYAASPFSAAMRRIVGNPTEVVAGAMGASPETQVKVGDWAGIAGEVMGPAGAVKAVQSAPAIARAIPEIMPTVNRAATAAGNVARSTINTADDVAKSIAQGAQARKAANIVTAAPTRTQLQDSATKLFDKAFDSGVMATADDVGRKIDNIPTLLKSKEGGRIFSENVPIDSDIYTHTKKFIDKLEGVRGKDLSLRDLDILRQNANEHVRKAFVANAGKADADAKGMMTLRREIDSLVDGLKATDEEAITALKEAKELWRRQAKMDAVETPLEIAKALNDPGYIKQAMRQIRTNPLEYKNFSKTEQKMIDSLAKKGFVEEAETGLPPLGLLRRGTYFLRGQLKKGVEYRGAEKLIETIARGEADQAAKAAAKATAPKFSERVAKTLGRTSNPERDAFYYAERARKANEKRK